MTQGFYKSRFKYLLKDYPINFARKQFYRTYFKVNHPSNSNEFIAVFGHMRAGSSLLTKLLCNNPQIMGYGETHMSLGSNTDVEAVSGKILYVLRKLENDNKQDVQVKYYLDKLLHNYLVPEGHYDFLLRDNIHIVFLIRNPEKALPSIMRLLNWDEQSAANYYIERLNGLVEYGKFLKGKKPFFFTTYQDILFDTETVFQDMELFLNLNYPLTENYAVTTQKGGDPSANLSSGKINRESAKKEDVIITPDIFQPASETFQRALSFFSLKDNLIDC